MIFILKIISLFILHWFIHYRIMISMSRWQNNDIEKYEFDNNNREQMAEASLIPIVATLIIIGGTIYILNEKHNILEFISNIGRKETKIVKKKIEEYKEKREIKKAEKEKIKNRFDILDL